MTTAPQRDIAIDALRGFALLGIIVVNAPYFAGPLAQMPTTTVDLAAFWFSTAFGMGKFFLIFSFLFGFGFSIMLGRAAGDQSLFKAKYFRRLSALFLIGALHAVFFFFGDILMLYACLGIVLWLCRNCSTKTLITAAAVLGVLGLLFQWLAMLVLPEAAYDFASESQRTANYLGSFFQVTSQRLADLPGTLAFILIFNGLPALSMFLLGLGLGRNKVFPPVTNSQLFTTAKKCFVGGAVVSATASFFAVKWADPVSGALSDAGAAAMIAVVVAGPVLSFGMALTALDFFNKNGDQRVTQWLAVAGGSSLTGYVLHSILLAVLFCGWGIGLYQSLGAGPVLAIGVATWLVVVAVIKLWRRHFRYGPDEWLLRSITDLQWKPFLNGTKKP
jgi:uncharacterized protein